MRVARNVEFTIKNGKVEEFNKVLADQVIPMLRKEEGFWNEVTLMHDNLGVGISIWNNRKALEHYEKTTYPKVLAALQPLLEKAPVVKTYDVGLTTLAA